MASRELEKPMNRLFVYGIFLDEFMRDKFAMTDPHYATVRGWATKGGSIVRAVADNNYTLTGLVVDVSPYKDFQYADTTYSVDNWMALDSLEAGYDRIVVTTTDGEDCWMYISK